MSDVPTCAACYAEGETACDGLYRKEKPCAWRDPCRQLRNFFRVTGLPREKTLQGMTKVDVEKLAQTVTTSGYLESALADFQEAKDRARPRRSRKFKENVWRLHRHFEQQLADRFGEKRLANRMHEGEVVQVLFRPGTFYPIDRTERSDRVAWYCKTAHDADRLVAVVVFRPALDAVNIGLPVDILTLRRHFSEETLRKLNPGDAPWRQVKTWCSRMSYEGIGVAVGTLKKLVDLKVYPLPELGDYDV